MLLTSLMLVAVGPKLILAHTMPWFEAKPYSPSWGWHWTMGKTNPDKGEIATHYHPLIGPYDSGDPDVLECQVQQMKLAGIDGVTIDWYGIHDCYDYAGIHRHARKLVDVLTRAGMKFALVYEDRSMKSLVDTGKLKAEETPKAGNETMRWAQDHWFSLPNYVRLQGRPLLMVFGPEYFKGEAWNEVFAGLRQKPYLLTRDTIQPPAEGAFSWLYPKDWRKALDYAYRRSKGWPVHVPPAFPRFHDYYREAGLHESYGRIEDRDGKTYEETLGRAMNSGSPIVQIVTWNDWGEGTQIEPSREFGYRELETTQRLTRSPYKPADLRLPIRLLDLRRKGVAPEKCSKASELLLQGKVTEAKRILEKLDHH